MFGLFKKKGGEAPEEIAVSILAELLMIRYGKTKADL